MNTSINDSENKQFSFSPRLDFRFIFSSCHNFAYNGVEYTREFRSSAEWILSEHTFLKLKASLMNLLANFETEFFCHEVHCVSLRTSIVQRNVSGLQAFPNLFLLQLHFKRVLNKDNLAARMTDVLKFYFYLWNLFQFFLNPRQKVFSNCLEENISSSNKVISDEKEVLKITVLKTIKRMVRKNIYNGIFFVSGVPLMFEVPFVFEIQSERRISETASKLSFTAKEIWI